MKSYILSTYSLQLGIAQQVCAGVSEQQARQSFPEAPSPILWQLGHVTVITDSVLGLLNAPKLIDPSISALFGNGTTLVPSVEYPPFSQFILWLEQGHAAVEKAFLTATDEHLASPVPIERLRSRFPLVGDAVLFLMTGHEAYHLAMISDLRRRLGLPPR